LLKALLSITLRIIKNVVGIFFAFIKKFRSVTIGGQILLSSFTEENDLPFYLSPLYSRA
jgi:hypothetical protein